MILAFYGAGAMGREFKYVADETGQWPEMVFIDDRAAAESLLGCPVVSFQAFRKTYSPDETQFVITIGEPKFRKEAFDRMKEAGYRGGTSGTPLGLYHPRRRGRRGRGHRARRLRRFACKSRLQLLCRQGRGRRP